MATIEAVNTVRPVQALALDRAKKRLQAAAQPPWLHAEVARRMAERLAFIRQRPKKVANWNAQLGASAELLRKVCVDAELIDVESEGDASTAAARHATGKPAWWRQLPWQKQRLTLLDSDVAPASVNMLWSNMALHGVVDPQVQLTHWRRCIADDGFLMFSTLGPGTLEGLRTLYAQCGWPSPMAPLVDMHDLGDMMVHAGFADPVMDQEQVTLTWAHAKDMLTELRSLGANVDPNRAQGLRTPRWRDTLEAAISETQGRDGRVAMTFEIVYGHAFCPVPKPQLGSQTQVSLEHMRRLVKAGRAQR